MRTTYRQQCTRCRSASRTLTSWTVLPGSKVYSEPHVTWARPFLPFSTILARVVYAAAMRHAADHLVSVWPISPPLPRDLRLRAVDPHHVRRWGKPVAILDDLLTKRIAAGRGNVKGFHEPKGLSQWPKPSLAKGRGPSVRPSVRPSVGPSVRPSVGWSVRRAVRPSVCLSARARLSSVSSAAELLFAPGGSLRDEIFFFC